MFRKLALAALITVSAIGGVKGQLPYLEKRLAGKGYDVSFFKDPRFSYNFQFPKNNDNRPLDYTNTSRCYYMRDSSILESIRFMEREREWLEKEEKVYGIPKVIIAAILNIESYFGKNSHYYLDKKKGVRLPAINALAKQYAVSSSQRKNYFAWEMENFLDIYREFGDDLFEIYGSSAGAITDKQFMPSNIRKFSVDLDKNGKIEHYGKADNIGSIGNFLDYHGYDKNPTHALMSYNYSRNYVKAVKAHANVLEDYIEKHGIYPPISPVEFLDAPPFEIEPPDTLTLREIKIPVTVDTESGRRKGPKKHAKKTF